MNLCHDNYDWKQLPIPDVPPEKQAPIGRWWSGFWRRRNHPLSQRGEQTGIPALEAEIDRLVYALYGLTEEEIVEKGD